MITSRSDHGGGPRHVAALLSNGDRRFDFYTAAPDEKPYFPVFCRYSRKCVPLPHRRFSLVSLYRLIFFVKRKKIDIIHSHGTGAGIYGRLIRFFVPRVVSIHTFHGIHQRKSGLVQAVYLAMEKLLGFFTDRVIFVSPSERDRARESGLKTGKGEIILNGTDNSFLNGLKADPGARELLGTKPGQVLVATLGRISYPKAVEVGVQAVSLLIEQGKEVYFIIAGDGEERNLIEGEIKRLGLENNARVLGSLDNPWWMLKAADIFMITSRWEGLSLAVLEAMACGLPVVATRVSGLVEAVEDGVTGLLAAPGDPGDLSRALAELVDNPPLRKEMGLRGRQRALDLFDAGRMARQTFNLYERELDEKHGKGGVGH